MKIGIYGGTFDPPHLGHMMAAKAAAQVLCLDRLLLIPTAQPPHKDLPANAADAVHRQSMTAAMADGLCLALARPGFATVEDIELTRSGPSYTADTLQLLRERYPEDELWLFMGTDMFLTFYQWQAPEQIAEIANLAVFARGQGDEAALEAQAIQLSAQYSAQTKIIPLEQVVELSSTELRSILETDCKSARGLLWCQVYGYILLHGLYGTKTDLKHLTDDDLRCISWSMIQAKRVPHIQGTEEEAVRLANRWGADPELARRAGILHDCTKYLTLQEQLTLCHTYEIPLDQLERETTKLLHAKTGAALAKHIFGVPDELYWAIYWHTTGKEDMSVLEKVIYLADYIEPNRAPFPGLEEMRRLAYEDLDAAILLGCELSIEDMNERGSQVHRNTQRARDFLKGRME